MKLNQTEARSLVPSTSPGPHELQSSCRAGSAVRARSASKASSFAPRAGRAPCRMWGPRLCCTSPPRAAGAVSPASCQCPACSSSLVWVRWGFFCYWSCSTLCGVVRGVSFWRGEGKSRALDREWGEVGFRFCFDEC